MKNKGMGRIPTAFISSTCYDLKQIRTDLKNFFENHLGFEVMLSENDSFPLDPSVGPVENCIRTVRERADIFVLIIGSRYGNILNNGKSVTNLEYINALAIEIPIYVFVVRDLFNIVQIWKSNPTSDFSTVVDNTKLLEFVNDLREKEGKWVYGFECAQDIVDTLRKQIGYLFYDSLNLRRQIRSQKLSKKIMQLEGEAFRIVLEKPTGWEYLLLGEIMENRFKLAENIKRDLKFGISFKDTIKLSDIREVEKWIFTKTSELLSITSALSALINKAIPVAIGEPGQPGDADYIIHVAEQLGIIYEKFINWGLDFKTISVDEDFERVINALSHLWISPINDLDNYCVKYQNQMRNLKTLSEENEEPVLDLTLVLSEPDLTEYYTELALVKAKHNL